MSKATVKSQNLQSQNLKIRSPLPYRAWLEVDARAIGHNVKVIGSLIGQAKIMAVVKSNAYGMGASHVAHAVKSAGVSSLGVGNIEEALILEGHGIKGPFFLLEPPLPPDIPLIVEHRSVQSLNAFWVAKALSKEAARQGKVAEAHLNANTGMNRLGMRPEEILERIEEIQKLPALRITGIMTHFSSADQPNKTATLSQIGKFEKLLKALNEKNIRFPVRHVANSATILDIPHLAMDMARIGILLYGVAPSQDVRQEPKLKPALTLKSKIAHVFRAEKGEGVSYGRTWTLPESGTLATLPIGTSDGIPGALSNKAEVLLRGKRYPIAGRICMDLLMIYLGTDKAEIGDEVIFLGESKGNRIGVLDWAQWGDLDAHEILTGLGGKLPKVYI